MISAILHMNCSQQQCRADITRKPVHHLQENSEWTCLNRTKEISLSCLWPIYMWREVCDSFWGHEHILVIIAMPYHSAQLCFLFKQMARWSIYHIQIHITALLGTDWLILHVLSLALHHISRVQHLYRNYSAFQHVACYDVIQPVSQTGIASVPYIVYNKEVQ